jgi:hypothetical protein
MTPEENGNKNVVPAVSGRPLEISEHNCSEGCAMCDEWADRLRLVTRLKRTPAGRLSLGVGAVVELSDDEFVDAELIVRLTAVVLGTLETLVSDLDWECFANALLASLPESQ